MKLYAYIEPSAFKVYLAEKQSVETEESRSLFLKDIGTTGILFDRVKVGYVEVSPGSCIRLRPGVAQPVAVPSSDLQSVFSRLWNWCK
jgi:hypothetical protein